MLDAVSACQHKPQAAAERVRRQNEANTTCAMVGPVAGQRAMTAMDLVAPRKRASNGAAI